MIVNGLRCRWNGPGVGNWVGGNKATPPQIGLDVQKAKRKEFWSKSGNRPIDSTANLRLGIRNCRRVGILGPFKAAPDVKSAR